MSDVSNEYAKALFMLATEKECREEYKDALETVVGVFDENPVTNNSDTENTSSTITSDETVSDNNSSDNNSSSNTSSDESQNSSNEENDVVVDDDGTIRLPIDKFN